MSQIILRHLEALSAQMHLAVAQLEALRHAMTMPAAEVRTPEVPARCAGIAAEHCALREADWISRKSFGNPTLVRCGGCGYEQDRATGE